MLLHDIQVSKRFQDSSIIKVFKHKECLLFLEKLGIQICEKHSNAKKLVLHPPSRLSLLQFLLLHIFVKTEMCWKVYSAYLWLGWQYCNSDSCRVWFCTPEYNGVSIFTNLILIFDNQACYFLIYNLMVVQYNCLGKKDDQLPIQELKPNSRI